MSKLFQLENKKPLFPLPRPLFLNGHQAHENDFAGSYSIRAPYRRQQENHSLWDPLWWAQTPFTPSAAWKEQISLRDPACSLGKAAGHQGLTHSITGAAEEGRRGATAHGSKGEAEPNYFWQIEHTSRKTGQGVKMVKGKFK